MARKWYVIHTYSGYENKVKANLEHRILTMGMADEIFDVFIPKQVVTDYKGGGRKTTSEKKVFPGYILVQMELTDDSWSVVRNTPGVTGFVGSEGKPVPLSRPEVESIRSTSTESEKPKYVTDFALGETVKVTSGPFADFDGTIAEVNPDQGKIRVMVSMFGRETPIELSFDQVKKI
jgi:transcriptional antiterminator NusG